MGHISTPINSRVSSNLMTLEYGINKPGINPKTHKKENAFNAALQYNDIDWTAGEIAKFIAALVFAIPTLGWSFVLYEANQVQKEKNLQADLAEILTAVILSEDNESTTVSKKGEGNFQIIGTRGDTVGDIPVFNTEFYVKDVFGNFVLFYSVENKSITDLKKEFAQDFSDVRMAGGKVLSKEVMALYLEVRLIIRGILGLNTHGERAVNQQQEINLESDLKRQNVLHRQTQPQIITNLPVISNIDQSENNTIRRESTIQKEKKGPEYEEEKQEEKPLKGKPQISPKLPSATGESLSFGDGQVMDILSEDDANNSNKDTTVAVLPPGKNFVYEDSSCSDAGSTGEEINIVPVEKPGDGSNSAITNVTSNPKNSTLDTHAINERYLKTTSAKNLDTDELGIQSRQMNNRKRSTEISEKNSQNSSYFKEFHIPFPLAQLESAHSDEDSEVDPIGTNSMYEAPDADAGSTGKAETPDDGASKIDDSTGSSEVGSSNNKKTADLSSITQEAFTHDENLFNPEFSYIEKSSSTQSVIVNEPTIAKLANEIRQIRGVENREKDIRNTEQSSGENSTDIDDASDELELDQESNFEANLLNPKIDQFGDLKNILANLGTPKKKKGTNA